MAWAIEYSYPYNFLMAGKSYWLFVNFNCEIFNVIVYVLQEFYFYLSYLITFMVQVLRFNSAKD